MSHVRPQSPVGSARVAHPNLGTPYRFSPTDDDLARVMKRVSEYVWHEMPDDGGWEYGTNLPYLKDLCDYWVREFNWWDHQAKLDQFNHFQNRVDGIDTHYLFEKGSGPNPTPLLIAHGWPGSICEFLDIVEPLAHPERFGGSVEQAFDVIAPSLPGFGFSSRPARPMGPRAMAHHLNKLMTEHLGYTTYMAQGGDWGGAICSWLGFDHSQFCKAVHINVLTMRHALGPQTVAEQQWSERFDRDQQVEDGYRTVQATRPQTLSYAMNDSPVGIAAWLIEKFRSWSDIRDGDIESVYSKGDLIFHVMIYILTRTFNTASWIYYGRREEGGRILSVDEKRVEVPTACAVFPAEMLAWPPRTYVDRLYNVAQWTDMPRGGHFAAMEEPELLVEDIQKFHSVLKTDRLLRESFYAAK